MKKRRWCLYAGGALLLVLTCAMVWWLLGPRPRISRAVFNELRLGMKLDDVERIIKVPPGDYSTELRNFDFVMTRGGGDVGIPVSGAALMSMPIDEWQAKWPDLRLASWRGRHRALIVAFDAHGMAKTIVYAQGTAPPNDWLGRIRFWIESRFEEQD